MTSSLTQRPRKEYPNDPDVDELLAYALSSATLVASNSSGPNGTPRYNKANRGGRPSLPGGVFPPPHARPAREKTFYSFPQGSDNVAKWQFWPKSMWLGSLTGAEYTRVSMR